MSYRFLLDLGLILLSTKVMSMVTRKFQMPQVVGALLAGLILGPAILNVISETEFITQIAELGVIVIIFDAGMGTNIKELKKTGKSGFMVALCGVIVPLIMGTLLAWIGERTGLIVTEGGFIEDVFVGTVLTATSVSITVATLKELGKLNTKVGNTILAAALIDDVLGLIALTLVSSFAGEDTNIVMVLVKIALFFAFAFGVGFAAVKGFQKIIARENGRDLRLYPILAFVLCLVMAYCAEKFFGVADIIGAYAAGLVVSSLSKAEYIKSKFEPISYLMLTPVFFASVGINVDVSGTNNKMILFSIMLLVVAIVSKLIGCGLGARICHFTGQECIQVGTGMACRGEVALIVANHAVSMGVLSRGMMTPVIITVIGCAILTPIMLKFVFRNAPVSEMHESTLVDRISETEQLDIVGEQLLEENKALMSRSKKEETAPENK